LIKIDAERIRAVIFAPDVTLLGVVDNAGVVRFFETGSFEEVWQTKGVGCASIAFSTDSALVATGGERVQVFDVRKRAKVADLDANTTAIQRIAFSADGKVLATTSPDLVVNLWSLSEVVNGKSK
jgi:WD40 repeat protein